MECNQFFVDAGILYADLSVKQKSFVYADEADVLNMALFGITAAEWRKSNSEKQGNIRDHATIEQLLVLANLENVNALYIGKRIPQSERVAELNRLAREQLSMMLKNKSVDSMKRLEEGMKNVSCPQCKVDLLHNHILVDDSVVPMKNLSKIVYPKCSVCGYPIQIFDVETNIDFHKKVLLISGTAGVGKSALGQFIEEKSDYIFVDGDAISKRVNHYARLNPNDKTPDYQQETIRTMMVLLGLGYDVIVGYVINNDVLKCYYENLSKYQVKFTFRVLVPERSVCIQRDIDRKYWTAGTEYVDRWYEEQRAYLLTSPEACLDTSKETLEETYIKHFKDLL